MGNQLLPTAAGSRGAITSAPHTSVDGTAGHQSHFRFPSPRSSFRPGITLLEVLIAVGVLTIGLLSLASLIPVAKYQLAEGAKMDRGSTLGRAAYRTLQAGQWLRPEMWLYSGAGGSGATTMGSPVVYSSRFQPFTSSTGTAQPPLVPLVLDPLMIGVNTPNPAYNSGANNNGQRLVQTFPYGVGTGSQGGPEGVAPIIPRITLRNVPGPYYAGNSLVQLTMGGADRLFRGTDDLVYNNNVNLQVSTLTTINEAGAESQTFVSSGTTPTLQFIGASGLTTNAINMSYGDYSWLVAIQPDLSQAFGGQPASATLLGLPGFYDGNASTLRQFQASVVVFQKRPLIPLANSSNIPGTININQTVDPNARGERLAFADFIGRGSVRLRANNNNLIHNIDDATKYLSVRSNEWILVTGRRLNSLPNPYNNSTSGWIETSLHWYQVVTISPPQNWSGQWFVDAVVVGDDWTQNGANGQQAWLYQDESGFGYSDYPNPPSGIATLLTGAIGVYTKTVTLDSSSLWGDR